MHLAALNLPSQVKGAKSNLLPHPQRTQRAVEEWDSHNITVVCLNELATTSRKTIDDSPHWRLVTSTNDVKDNGTEIGNGIAYRGDIWHLVDEVRLPVPMLHRPTPLKQIVVLLQRREGQGQVSVMCVHHPTRSADNAAESDRQACIEEENRYANKLFQAGLTVLLAGDFNDGNAIQRMNPEKWKEGAHKDKTVDWVMCRKDTGCKFGDEKFDNSVHGTVTDHPTMPHVKAEFPHVTGHTALPPK